MTSKKKKKGRERFKERENFINVVGGGVLLLRQYPICLYSCGRVSTVYTLVAESQLFILWWPSLPSVILLGLESQLFILLWWSLPWFILVGVESCIPFILVR